MEQGETKFDDTQGQIFIRLLQNRLTQAQQALEHDNLAEAKDFYHKAMLIEGHHPERAPRIRRALKQYSDRVAAQTPPDWRQANEALEVIDSLNLADDETQSWQQRLKLNQAKFLLMNHTPPPDQAQQNLEQSFKILGSLLAKANDPALEPQFKADIARLAQSYVAQQAEQHQWSLAGQAVHHLERLWPDQDGFGEWLKTIAKIATEADQEQIGLRQQLTALEEKISIEDQAIHQQLQRYRNLNYILIGLCLVAIVVYPVILFVFFPNG